MDWDEILDPVSPLYQETMQEQMRVVDMQDGLIAAAKKLLETHYPDIQQLTPRHARQLETAIVKHAVNMAIDMHLILQGREAGEPL
ncbi:hypothetical protein [Chitinophaga nivalis]|uniref:Uncharacterized protein n=1 Tax=Chitinophaga nivalis TaxID=2991709 RepID=A0ABT3IT99_9BACT|nr:hypothetical protein [Chitinophaga nivalis]MCW3463107.1 hypothetical protein [Chitinophaga nivalis]MCW3487203.1 hypothetical protein [Chitinophaga nivalis]